MGNGVWQELLHNKYIGSKTLARIESKPNDSPFWEGIMGVKNEFFNHISFKLGNGHGIRFWEDPWLGDQPLSDSILHYITLFGKRICR